MSNDWARSSKGAVNLDPNGTEDRSREIAGALRATEDMATAFADRVQERLGRPVSHERILAVMHDISIKRLTMDRVVQKLRRELDSRGKGNADQE
jgi:hypothetical protein